MIDYILCKRRAGVSVRAAGVGEGRFIYGPRLDFPTGKRWVELFICVIPIGQIALITQVPSVGVHRLARRAFKMLPCASHLRVELLVVV